MAEAKFKKGDLVERLQGMHVIDVGIVLELCRKYGKETGYVKVYWQALQKEQRVHKQQMRHARKSS